MLFLILNITIHLAPNKTPTDTSKLFMFGKICFFRAMLGSIGRSKSPYIVDLILCPLGKFTLIFLFLVKHYSVVRILI